MATRTRQPSPTQPWFASPRGAVNSGATLERSHLRHPKRDDSSALERVSRGERHRTRGGNDLAVRHEQPEFKTQPTHRQAQHPVYCHTKKSGQYRARLLPANRRGRAAPELSLFRTRGGTRAWSEPRCDSQNHRAAADFRRCPTTSVYPERSSRHQSESRSPDPRTWYAKRRSECQRDAR